jgi:DNA (cytosine-5)-methyltransferase 1
MNSYIPVVDLFAGPGGLGEGFSAFKNEQGTYPFKVALSIEKDEVAHETLLLRAFFREFRDTHAPDEYYQYLRREISKKELFEKYPEQYKVAEKEAWLAELGNPAFPDNIVDRHIIDAISDNRSWVLTGGPPCQAYSVIGRSRMKNDKTRNFEEDHRYFLYKEYLRIVVVHNPPVFIMENVQGILSSKVKGEEIFNKIINDLRSPCSVSSDFFNHALTNSFRYNIYSLVKAPDNEKDLKPAEYIIKAEKYGIPQKRHRVILLGIREDIKIRPIQLIQSENMANLSDVILKDLPKLRSGVSKSEDSYEAWLKAVRDILAYDWMNDKNFDQILKNEIITAINSIDPDINKGSDFIAGNIKGICYKADWFYDNRLGGVCNHKARNHMITDLHRYLFAACFTKIYNRPPKLCDFPNSLLPAHKNVESGIKGKMFSDRFRVQMEKEAATTITSHISKDGHYYIHPDPSQCRSLTVREAARLQTFPDNYFFEGNQTQQYHQVGNAVPPLLALQIGGIVHRIFKGL